ncbi:MAG: hypothetical protein NDI82_13095 [Anaeromyxobacteraceae bacterium]|nr:hypothetical protein [Anaeromyxobacteraceae bacterium]
MPRPALLALALLALAGGCTRGADAEAKARVFAKEDPPAGAGAAPAGLDDPRALLDLDAGEAARRLGSLDWRGAVKLQATRQGDSAARVQQVERHRVRQLVSGEFEVESEQDGGGGPGAVTGKHVIWAGGMTYARGHLAPFRERPTDRGRDARRYRDESFCMLGELARLYGPALTLTAAGEEVVLGRTARRFTFSLAPGQAAPAEPAARDFGAGGPDADTRRHLAFLDGRVPVAAAGEVLLDALTGVPLRGTLRGAFSVKDDARVRVQVEVSGEVKALGEKVAAVAAPRNPLPDARKPAGVAAALEQAGLKARDRKGEAAEPADEGP